MNKITAPAHMIADARAIKEQLRATEASADELLFNTLELGKRLLTARRNPGVAPSEGQAALVRLSRAISSSVEAQNDLLRVHGEMNKVGMTVGVLDEDGTTPMATFTSASDTAAAGEFQTA